MSAAEVTSTEALRGIYPPPAERSLVKEVDRLDGHCRRFIALSPFLVLSSADGSGACDASPKGGPPGFVHVLGPHRLLIPDATGNRRLDSLNNLLENPHVGLLFLIPGMGEMLRVNGTAALTCDPSLLGGLETGGHAAKLALLVEVERAYLHCAKALLRSRLWDPDAWPAREELPSAAEIYADHMRLPDRAASAAMLEDSYTNRL